MQDCCEVHESWWKWILADLAPSVSYDGAAMCETL